MRMRGLEPPPGHPDTDLNRARLPIPPHPLVEGEDIAPAAAAAVWLAEGHGRAGFASLDLPLASRHRLGD
jgi:hypothetical protein